MYISGSQEKNFIAIIPTFHDRLNRSGSESPLELRRQKFVLFVYRNAVAVYSEGDFVNPTMDTIYQELALPSTGHEENRDTPGGRISNGILSIQMWVEGERISPNFIQEGNEDWYTIKTRFSPGEKRKVKAMFWAQTSLTNIDPTPGLDTVPIAIGNRGFMIDFFMPGVWNSNIQSVDITVVLKGGLSFQRDSLVVEPNIYDFTDSTITWSLKGIEPSADDNIVVLYNPAGAWRSTTNTMAKLSAYLVHKVYDNLLNYVEQMKKK